VLLVPIGCPPRAGHGNLLRATLKRAFLTVRQELKRFERKTLGYSKSLEMHKFEVALHFGVYNFVRQHHILGTTPAVAASSRRETVELRTGRGNHRRLHAAQKRMPILIRNCLTGSEPWASEARQAPHLSINQFGDGLLIARISSERRDFPIGTNTS